MSARSAFTKLLICPLALVGALSACNQPAPIPFCMPGNTIPASATSGPLVSVGDDGVVQAVVPEKGGNVLVGGHSGKLARGVMRFKANGDVDTTFSSALDPGADVFALALDGAGNVYVGGQFTAGTRKNFVRLNSTGALDGFFDVSGEGPDGVVRAIAVNLTSTDVVIAGNFGTVNGATNPSRARIARLKASGLLAPDFAAKAFPDSEVTAVAVDAIGRVVIGGPFTALGMSTHTHIARLNYDGSEDKGFTASVGLGGTVDAIRIDAAGNIVIAGGFNKVNDESRSNVARLTPGLGALDPTFNPNLTIAGPVTGRVFALDIDSVGNIAIGGSFRTVGNSSDLSFAHHRGGLARLLPSGFVDSKFNPTPDSAQNKPLNFEGDHDIKYIDPITNELIVNEPVKALTANAYPCRAVVVGGQFNRIYKFDNRRSLGRFLSDNATFDTSF